MRSVMKLYRPAVLFLFSLTITTTGSESGPPVVKVKLHDSAVLPCTEKCPGVASWTFSDNRSDPLAECDQTECRSVKEGYQMQRDFSLIITEADFSKRGRYTCQCDDRDVHRVQLQIEPLETPVQIKSGDSLVMELDISDPVEVVYNSSKAAGPSSGRICTVSGHSLQFTDDYKQRTSLSSNLELREMSPSDSGVYTIRTIRSKEIIHIYNVTVTAYYSLEWKNPGDTLVLKMSASLPVDVFYRSIAVANKSLVKICSVIGRSLNCTDEYRPRASLTSSGLELRGMRPSDAGFYGVLDARNKEIVSGYVVSVSAPLNPVLIKSGESLLLALDVSDPVEVIYKKRYGGGRSEDQICTVDGGVLNCTDKFKERASLKSFTNLFLRGMKSYESGDYIVQNIRTKEIIKTYSVVISGFDSDPDTDEEAGYKIAGVPWWVWFVVPMAGILVFAIMVRCCRRLMARQVRNEEDWY